MWKLMIAAAVAAACVAAGPALAKERIDDVGKVAPSYTVVTLDGQSTTSEALQGKVVVLNYWATWCAPCKVEMIAFDNYLRQHPNPDLKVYGIATENSVPAYRLKDLSRIVAFPLAKKLISRAYGVRDGVPTSYVIDRSGVIRHARAGAFTEESFARLVSPLLDAPAPTAATQ